MANAPFEAWIRKEGSRPLVFGHRGMRGTPENTLISFTGALAAGADGIELDVRLCKGGEVVVFHDADLRRMAGRAERVVDLDYSTLQKLDLGGGATVPLLSEVLSLALPRGARVNVEIKPDVPELLPLVAGVAREILARPAHERALLVVSSFSPRALVALHQRLPDVAVGYLFDSSEAEQLTPELAHYGVHPQHTLLDERSLARMRKHARFVNTWTVNDAAAALRLAELGVDVIISDVPEALIAAFGRKT